MLTVFSLIYAPLIIWLTNSFSVEASSVVILFASGILVILNFREKNLTWVVPFVYFIISLTTLIFAKNVLLRFTPLLISFGVAMLFSIPQKTDLFIRNILNKQRFLKKIEMPVKFLTLNVWIWSVAAWINLLLHICFLAFASDWLWAFYVSVGWYSVFVFPMIFNIVYFRIKGDINS